MNVLERKKLESRSFRVSEFFCEMYVEELTLIITPLQKYQKHSHFVPRFNIFEPMIIKLIHFKTIYQLV